MDATEDQEKKTTIIYEKNGRMYQLYVMDSEVTETITTDTPGHTLQLLGSTEECEAQPVALDPGNSNSSMTLDTEAMEECPICCVPVPLRQMQTHQLSHNVDKPFACSICNKLFRRKQDMQIHVRSHTNEKPYMCKICGVRYTQHHSLKQHLTRHSDESSYFTCHICQKNFTTKKSCMLHLKHHSGQKPHACKLCNKSFLYQSALKKHQSVHSGEKPYKCDFCGRCFALMGTLTCHQLLHTGERPHVCAICKKRFTQLSGLQQHVLIHSDVRAKHFACEFCNKSFYTAAVLERHQYIHTGEKPHMCRVCGVGFNQKNNLERHLTTLKHKMAAEETGLGPSGLLQAGVEKMVAIENYDS